MYRCPHFFPVNCNICLRSVTETWLSWNSAQHRQISTLKHMCWPCSVLKTEQLVCIEAYSQVSQCLSDSLSLCDYPGQESNVPALPKTVDVNLLMECLTDWKMYFKMASSANGAGSMLPFPGGTWLPTLVFSISAAMKLSRVKATHTVLVVCRSTLKMFGMFSTLKWPWGVIHATDLCSCLLSMNSCTVSVVTGSGCLFLMSVGAHMIFLQKAAPETSSLTRSCLCSVALVRSV